METGRRRVGFQLLIARCLYILGSSMYEVIDKEFT